MLRPKHASVGASSEVEQLPTSSWLLLPMMRMQRMRMLGEGKVWRKRRRSDSCCERQWQMPCVSAEPTSADVCWYCIRRGVKALIVNSKRT